MHLALRFLVLMKGDLVEALYFGLLFLAIISFVIAAVGVKTNRAFFGWLGLVFWVLAHVIQTSAGV